MQKGIYKRSGLDWLFTDCKHHSQSWKNSKRMRAKRERQWLKKFPSPLEDKSFQTYKEGENGTH